jgi:hypothetical protein
MGIKGLGGFIKWKIPNARKSVTWAGHSGERWGVDCSCLLYRARGAGLSPLTVIASLLVRLRRCGIEPVFIFDGRPPAAKADVVDQRRVFRQAAHKEMADIKVGLEAADLTAGEKSDMERRHADLQKKAPVVTGGDKDEIKKLLYGAGVQFVTASGEADDVLAFLCRTGYLQAVLSTDMDMLPRGVPLLVIPETADATVLTQIKLADVLVGLGLDYPQFVNACMLMGSDYSGSWLGPKEAVALAKKGFAWSAVGADPSVMEQGVALLSGTGVQWEEIVSEKQRAKWDLGRPPCEAETLTAFATSNGWPTDWVRVLTIVS